MAQKQQDLSFILQADELQNGINQILEIKPPLIYNTYLLIITLFLLINNKFNLFYNKYCF